MSRSVRLALDPLWPGNAPKFIDKAHERGADCVLIDLEDSVTVAEKPGARAMLPEAKTARSQLIGGMVWGVSSALYEDQPVDTRYGSFVNVDLANYHVPVHADIPDNDAIVLDEFDAHANVLGSKDVGELGICGAGAAVANAVYNACGARVREYPITLDKVLPSLS